MVSWIKNPNSQRYKQLEYTLNKMDKSFTVIDMQNFLKYSWEVHGQNHTRGAGKKRRVYGYTGQTIARFLKTRNDIVVVNNSIFTISSPFCDVLKQSLTICQIP